MGKNIEQIVRLLKKQIKAHSPIVLNRSPFKLLIATVLSQRTRDQNTAIAARNLFSKYHTPKQLSLASEKEIGKLVRKSGFYKVKAKRIKQISSILAEKFSSRVPRTLDELLSLPGVGRKTANIVLSLSFGIPCIAVDTHVHRISNRLGFVKTKTPEQAEFALMKVVPKKHWIELNDLLVKHGQQTCNPRKPKCGECLLQAHCDYFKKTFSQGKQ